ncbi:MAG: glycosyltransferase family 4 protein, partial [Anaerolineales bacterium]
MNNRMVICLVARRIWTHGLGGMETHCRSLAEELLRQGHTVYIVTTAHPNKQIQETQFGAHIHYLPKTPPGDYSQEWWRASRHWGKEHVNALGVEAILSMSLAGQSMVGIPNGPPFFLIVHGCGWRQLKSFWHDSRGWWRLIEFPRVAVWVMAEMPRWRSALRKAAGVFAVSRELCDQLRRYRTHFVPNVVDTTHFRPNPVARATTRSALGISDADLVALMVGTVNWQKGVDLGLRACAEVAAEMRGLRAVVIGDGPTLGALARWARTEAPHLPLSFVGSRPNEELPPYYAAADIFLFPSRRQEGLPTTVLEAMATELPVIATRSGGTPTAVRDGETGLMASINDSRRFTEALRTLAHDSARRQALGAVGRRTAEEAFDVRIVVARLVEIMKG